MKKHLIRVGNSYAIIIDKSIRRLLYLGPRTVLEVSTDGQRIIIEPTKKLLDDREIKRAREILNVDEGLPPARAAASSGPVNRKALDLDAKYLFRELEYYGAFEPERFKALWHLPNPRIGRVSAWLSDPKCASEAGEDELATLQRIFHYRDRVKAGVSMAQATDEALRAFPKRAVPVVAAS